MITLDPPSKEQRLLCAARETLKLLGAYMSKDAVKVTQRLVADYSGGDSGSATVVDNVASTVATGKSSGAKSTKIRNKTSTAAGDMSSEQV